MIEYSEKEKVAQKKGEIVVIVELVHLKEVSAILVNFSVREPSCVCTLMYFGGSFQRRLDIRAGEACVGLYISISR